MKRKKRVKRVVSDLAFAVAGGAMTEAEAAAVFKLCDFAGMFRPDGNGPDNQPVRVKGNAVAKLKANTPAKASGKANDVFKSAAVLDAGARLSQKRYAVKRPDGNPLEWGGKALETSSEFDRAVCGVWAKAALKRLGVPCELTDWERSLLTEYGQKGQWVGTTPGGEYFGGGPDGFAPAARVKALLDDTVSGGIYLAPVVLDEAIIVKPLLSGQLFPFVDVRPISGRRITTPVMQQMTVGWGTAEGTPVQPFSTSGLVSPLDTAVMPVSGFAEIGNDLLSDTPVNVGAAIIEMYGERLKSELDRVIAVGNGVNEPLGIVNTTGLTAVSSDSGAAGPVTVGDAESLIFGVPLQYRMADLNPCFVMNDTSFRRFRGIQVGAGDERRVFGMGTFGTQVSQSYMLFEYAAKIQNDLPNGKAAFGCLKKYRLFQRMGMELIRESGGRQLVLSNTSLIGIRARFGGRVVDGSAFSLISDLQS